MKGHLAWSNGDTTGYGLHADFLNGWDMDILSKALNDPGCVNLGYSIEIQKWPVLAPYFDPEAGEKCEPARGQLDEPYLQGDGKILPRLPGCNLLWGATGPKPPCNPPIAGLNVSAFMSTSDPLILPESERRNFTLSDDEGWRGIGCYMATASAKPLGSKGISYMDDKMTPERCQQACAKNGYTYSGLSVVGGFSCDCSNTFDQGSAPVYSGCDTACPVGNETCGGEFLLLTASAKLSCQCADIVHRAISPGPLLSSSAMGRARPQSVRPRLLRVAAGLAEQRPRQRFVLQLSIKFPHPRYVRAGLRSKECEVGSNSRHHMLLWKRFYARPRLLYTQRLLCSPLRRK